MPELVPVPRLPETVAEARSAALNINLYLKANE